METRAPRYAEEDTRETSEKEIRGWYCYGLAAEVFAVCGVGELSNCSTHSYLVLKITCRFISASDSGAVSSRARGLVQ